MKKPKELTEEDKIRILANNEQQKFDKEQFDNAIKQLMSVKPEKIPKKNKN